jgi:hypothetical protein
MPLQPSTPSSTTNDASDISSISSQVNDLAMRLSPIMQKSDASSRTAVQSVKLGLGKTFDIISSSRFMLVRLLFIGSLGSTTTKKDRSSINLAISTVTTARDQAK